MPRPELYPVKKVIGFDQAMLKAIDNWRRTQSPIPTMSASIRQLVAPALARESEKSRPNRGKRDRV